MKGMLEEIIKNMNDPNQHVKKFIAMQTLGVLNFMHSNNTLNRGIRIQSPIIQQINRLQDVGLASDISILRSYKNSKKSIQAHFSYEIQKGFSIIQNHLQVFRLSMLELDNQDILQRQSIQHEDLPKNYQQKDILSQLKVQFTLKSNILKKDQAYLLSKYRKTRLTAELNFNCFKIKLLGGSEKQKMQACSLDDQQKNQQIQQNYIQNEDRKFKSMEIEEQQNSNFSKFLVEEIKNTIRRFDQMQTQSDKQEEKSQQNENQQFNENQDQNQNQNYNQLKELLTKTNNSKQQISEQDLSFIMGVNVGGEQVNVYEIGVYIFKFNIQAW
ncbi:hypothetical protein ABPG73_016981 [Tetrahymena malaccensis]